MTIYPLIYAEYVMHINFFFYKKHFNLTLDFFIKKVILSKN